MIAQGFSMLRQWCWCAAIILSVLAVPGYAQKPVPAASAAEASTFDVLEFVIDGNTVLPRTMVEKAIYSFLGERRTIKDVESARDALERAYHDAGYLSVVIDIPEQKVDERVVRLQVVEGRVDRLKVTGSRYYTLGQIRASVPALAAGEVPYFPQAQDQLAKLSTAADRKVTPVLRPGSAPGKLEVDLKVDDRLPVHGSLELNNRRSADTKPLRLAAALRYDNLWQRGHSAALSFQTSPEDTKQVKALFGSYTMTLPNSDKVLAVYAVNTSSSVSTVGGTNVLGDGTIVGARMISPLPGRSNFSHSLTLGMDYKHFGEATKLTGADTVRTPISYIPFLIGYNATSQDDSGITQLGATFNFGVRGIGDQRIDCFGQFINEFACKRFNASSNYSYVRAEASRTHTLPRGFTLFGKLDVQYSGQPLISNEQFSAGGGDTVRGYYESEVLGDEGFRGTIELRSPSLFAGDAKDAWGQLNVIAFFDGAALKVVEPLPSQTSRFTISSAGVGLRLKAVRGFVASVDIARPLRGTNRTPSGATRGTFRVAYEF